MKIQKINAFLDNAKNKMTAIASDESKDRQGDSLKIRDWDLKNFRKNPVLLYAHNHHEPPIGIVKKLRQEGKKLLFEPIFHEITQKAKEIKQLYEEGIMKGFSVGFIPHDTGKMELLEISAVPVPANANALLSQKSITDEHTEKATEIKDWVHSIDIKPVQEEKQENKIEDKTEEKKMWEMVFGKLDNLTNKISEIEMNIKGRKTKVLHTPKELNNRAIVKALQDINGFSNHLLRKIKSKN